MDTLKNASVIVIDDEEYIIETLIEYIEPLVHTVYEARSGEEGLKLIEKNNIEIAIIDVCMQGISGLDLLKEVKKIKPMVIPIIFSGFNNSENIRTALREHAYDFIEKPCSYDYLESCLHRAHRKYLTEKLHEEVMNLLVFSQYTDVEPNQFKTLAEYERLDILKSGITKPLCTGSAEVSKRAGSPYLIS